MVIDHNSRTRVFEVWSIIVFILCNQMWVIVIAAPHSAGQDLHCLRILLKPFNGLNHNCFHLNQVDQNYIGKSNPKSQTDRQNKAFVIFHSFMWSLPKNGEVDPKETRKLLFWRPGTRYLVIRWSINCQMKYKLNK